jgi:hypothetical protein
LIPFSVKRQEVTTLIEPQLPTFDPAERVGNKQHLSGIEKVNKIAVRVSMKPLFALSSAGLALPQKPLQNPYRGESSNLKKQRAQPTTDVGDPSINS